jgi:hypothetical protein
MIFPSNAHMMAVSADAPQQVRAGAPALPHDDAGKQGLDATS